MSDDFKEKLKRIAEGKSKAFLMQIKRNGDHFWMEREQSKAWAEAAELLRKLAYNINESSLSRFKIVRYFMYKIAHCYCYALRKSREIISN